MEIMGTERIKRVMDSVHGYVRIPESYMRDIIDTPEFQRLRRIEQTSCRALFPSARHDRFIHSIGVFHIGTLIAEHLWQQAQMCSERGEQTHFPLDGHTASIIITYQLACLLHDIGHTPFSHTFESFFHNDKNELLESLDNLIEDDNFIRDYVTLMPEGENNKLTPHEFCSAIIALENYGKVIDNKHHWKGFNLPGDKALLARMIVGCPYLDWKKAPDKKKSLENCFIELIHSKITDADGLDYVCRDVWASGYATSKVDLNRLIDSIRIYNDNGAYSVCYDFKGINDILGVLQVKSFQNEFVFNHHSVLFEQHLLVEAMKSAALRHEFGIDAEQSDTKRKNALRKLCGLDLFSKEGHETKNSKINISYVMDDDFVSLMKYCFDDEYVRHWFSRQYDYIPIWKTRESLMSDLPQKIKEAPIREEFWLYTGDCKKYIAKLLKIKQKDITILDVDITNRINRIMDVKLFVNQKVYRFDEIYKTINEAGFKTPIVFKLIYIPKRSLENISLKNLKEKLIVQCRNVYQVQPS